MDPIFKVTMGKGAFKIVDDYGTVFGCYAVEDDADQYCEMLNEKFEAMKVEFKKVRP